MGADPGRRMAEPSPWRATCAYLEQLLGEGWKIEQPVYLRPHWRSTANSNDSMTYHFILSRESQVNLVSVPEDSEIQRLLTEYELTVDSL